MSANLQFYIIIRFADFRGHSRTHTKLYFCVLSITKKCPQKSANVREYPRKSTIILVRECPRTSAKVRDIILFRRTFADFLGHSWTHKIIFLSFVYYESPRKSAKVRRTLFSGHPWRKFCTTNANPNQSPNPNHHSHYRLTTIDESNHTM